jgi:hypothetical protein
MEQKAIEIDLLKKGRIPKTKSLLMGALPLQKGEFPSLKKRGEGRFWKNMSGQLWTP